MNKTDKTNPVSKKVTKTIELQEGMIFYNYFSDAIEPYFKVTRNVVITVTYDQHTKDILASLVDELVQKDIIKPTMVVTTKLPHMELLFRLAIIFDDTELIQHQGQCTWLDDVEQLIKAEYYFPHEDLNNMFFSIANIIEAQQHSQYLDAREQIVEVDLMHNSIDDAMYELYKVLLRKWLVLPEVSLYVNLDLTKKEGK